MITCVGLATRDVIYRVPKLPGGDERVVASERRLAGGGPAATAAVTIAKLGVPARFVGVLDDPLAGVETIRVPGRMAQSLILVDGGARAIVAEPPSAFRCPAAALDGADWIHVDHVGYGSLPEGPLPAQLSVDAGNPIEGLNLDRVELLAPTAARDDGRRARVTVITRGERGCVAYTAEETIEVPGYPVLELGSTLGAGDVFHGALLAALVRGLGLRAALIRANVCAALSCRALDGRSAIPTWGEVEAALR